VNCKNIANIENYFFTNSEKEQNYGQSEQIFLKRKWKEKIVPACRSVRHAGREDDRCMSHFDTDSTLIAALCPALCDFKKSFKTQDSKNKKY